MKVKNLQEEFVKALAYQRYSPDLERDVIPPCCLELHEAIAVYQKAYIFRLVEALMEIYESCLWILGEETFFSIAKEYVLKHPSQSEELGQYGKFFPFFLKDKIDVDCLDVEICGIEILLEDLARFEWLFKEVFHSQPLEELSINQNKILLVDNLENENSSILAHKLENQKLMLKDGFSYFSSSFSIYKLWQLCQKKETHIPLHQFSFKEFVFLYKRGTEVYVQCIDAKFAPYIEELMKKPKSFIELVKFLEKSVESKRPQDLEEFTQSLFSYLSLYFQLQSR